MNVEIAGVRVQTFLGEFPPTWDLLCENAALDDRFELDELDHAVCGTALWRPSDSEWPRVVVTQGFSPGPQSGFLPGCLVVPETAVLFLGAGTRLLAYSLGVPTRLWEDEADTGFWSWHRHDDVVLMSAELELAGWSVAGVKLWSTFVEPPWSYSVHDGAVTVDVMGAVRSFSLDAGPGNAPV